MMILPLPSDVGLEVTIEQDDPTYGTEISCDSDWNAGATASGIDAIKQSVYRRITTKRGTCPGSPHDGLDIREYLHGDIDSDAVNTLLPLLRTEILKDDRIETVTIDPTIFETHVRFRIHVTTRSYGPFDLVVKANELDVSEVI